MTRKKLLTKTAVITLILWVGGFVVFAASSLSLSPQEVETKTDAIIVVTGGHNRIGTGIKLLQDGAAPKLLVSGVHEYYKSNDILANWDIADELRACCIALDFEATTTIENAQQIKHWRAKEGINSARLVSSRYHMKRAMMEVSAQNKGLKLISHPVMEGDIGAGDLYFWQVMVSEYHKTLWRTVVLGLSKITGKQEVAIWY
jgi:uncharacterized SAM-binding protein YcdF (DUF218 family)